MRATPLPPPADFDPHRGARAEGSASAADRSDPRRRRWPVSSVTRADSGSAWRPDAPARRIAPPSERRATGRRRVGSAPPATAQDPGGSPGSAAPPGERGPAGAALASGSRAEAELRREAVQRVNRAAAARGLTRTELARRARSGTRGWRRETVSRVLGGKQRPSWELLVALAEVVGQDLHDLEEQLAHSHGSDLEPSVRPGPRPGPWSR